jgi:hypothetical protein
MAPSHDQACSSPDRSQTGAEGPQRRVMNYHFDPFYYDAFIQTPRKCCVCLEPATKIEGNTQDKSYIRHVCDKHANNEYKK